MLRLGQILKSYGTEGELIISLAPEEIDRKEPVYLHFEGLPVPFFIESLVPRGTGKALVRLTGVTSLKDAEELVGLTVYAEGDEEETEDFIGWTLLDAHGIRVGTVSGFEDIPGNPCLEVQTTDGQEVLVPLHEDLLLSVDPSSETMVMRIPEGLL